MSMSLFEVAESMGDSLLGGTSPRAHRRKMEQNVALMREAQGMATLLRHYEEGSRRAGLEVIEAITTSDLARYASGALVDRQMLENYASVPSQWGKFCTPTTVDSFKPKYLSTMELGGNTFADVPERTPYQMVGGGELSEYPISVKKTGRLYGWSIEAAINDDLGQLLSIRTAFPQMAVDTEDDRALRLMVNLETGALNTNFFKAGNNNVGTLKLTNANLETVLTALRVKRDPISGGVMLANFQLVVGPALEATANRIVATSQWVTTTGGVTITEPNPMAGRIDVVVNEKQPGTSWMVLPKPGSAKRPTLLFAKLRGYEQPEFRYKADGGQLVSGGTVPAGAGSFDDDTVWYRGRHIMGVAHGDPTLTYGSDNLGT